ncbi:hypothetical protein HR060_02580 [Catenovulum sp. SM1970]|uniref:hypothetical protein n=1 Tax=Marinifaba aquimaris TaxID=2741323 RepID=UPI0015735F94|nr:hypothetical protein [Marinifaba aquimaris]NTS75742.1 hypothetical protein [Marinifaba aquimaris]
MIATLSISQRLLRANWLYFLVALIGLCALPAIPDMHYSMRIFVTVCFLAQFAATCGLELKAINCEQHAFVLPNYPKVAQLGVLMASLFLTFIFSMVNHYKGVPFELSFLFTFNFLLIAIATQFLPNQVYQAGFWMIFGLAFATVIKSGYTEQLDQLVQSSETICLLILSALAMTGGFAWHLSKKQNIQANQSASRIQYWHSMMSLASCQQNLKYNANGLGVDNWFFKSIKSPSTTILYALFWRDSLIVHSLLLISIIIIAITGSAGLLHNDPQYAFISLISCIMIGVYCIAFHVATSNRSLISQLWLTSTRANNQKSAKKYVVKLYLIAMLLPFILILVLTKPIQAAFSTGEVNWLLYSVYLFGLVSINLGLALSTAQKRSNLSQKIVYFLFMACLPLLIFTQMGIDFLGADIMLNLMVILTPITTGYCLWQYHQFISKDVEWAAY